MNSDDVQKHDIESTATKLGQIAISCLKLGMIGFGGIAGMVATIENEMVVKRKWIDHQHFMDVLSASYIIPGPNAVEVVMHCGKEKSRFPLPPSDIGHPFPTASISGLPASGGPTVGNALSPSLPFVRNTKLIPTKGLQYALRAHCRR